MIIISQQPYPSQQFLPSEYPKSLPRDCPRQSKYPQKKFLTVHKSLILKDSAIGFPENMDAGIGININNLNIQINRHCTA